MTRLLETLPPTEKMAGISTYQQFVNKGIEKGIEKLILNAFDNGNTQESISKFIGIPLDEVIDILRRNNRIS
jgi:hypothetical protein